MPEPSTRTNRIRLRFLDLIERIGNRLPDPITLFALGALTVMVASQIAAQMKWEVTKVEPVLVTRVIGEGKDTTVEPVLDPATGKQKIEWKPIPEETTTAKSLLTSDGIYWAINNLVDNFMHFRPLGVVLVGMLGIGVAELTGLLPAVLKLFMLIVPRQLLTPAVVFIGIMSSMTLDAGYVVLPPLVAALYQAAGRSPLAGIAAAFAGVSAGFNANLLITGLDPMLAELSTEGAQAIDPTYEVAATCNLWFMIASTFTMTGVGWFTTAWFIERRLRDKPPEEGGPVEVSDSDLASQRLTATEKSGLFWAAATAIVFAGLLIYMIRWPGMPLHGDEGKFPRWVHAIVPLIFIGFIIPGIAFGIRTGKIKSDKSLSQIMTRAMATMAPIIVLSFFAAQFIEFFRYSRLDTMLAMSGGQALARAQLSPMILIVVFILMTAVFNLFVGSMSAKYAMFAPIFVPMLMMISISPELTQAAYRIGDSITNIITPLNAYLIIILVVTQRYVPKAGMGTLISAMMPYTFTFGIVWTLQILLWMWAGWDLGIGGPLVYPPP